MERKCHECEKRKEGSQEKGKEIGVNVRKIQGNGKKGELKVKRK